MENHLTAEMLKQAKAANTPEELMSIAKENGMALTAEEAKAYYEKLNKVGELSDDELDNVSGGGCGFFGDDAFRQAAQTKGPCPNCGSIGTVVEKVEVDFGGSYAACVCTACGKKVCVG